MKTTVSLKRSIVKDTVSSHGQEKGLKETEKKNSLSAGSERQEHQAPRHRLQVRRHRVDEPRVQLVAEFVQHHVVRVAVQLLEGEVRGVLPVDLVDRLLERRPRPVGVLGVHLLVVPERLDDEF